ncbi:MAG: phytoene/squalene synthase family protein [Acidobacteriia bacterium]|nr:phytoene/squalene synthase family protein [Terriglobia bacterium]
MRLLDASYRHCRQITRNRARNFYYAFRLLDPARRDSICAIYAFMRHCDDLSDEPGATQDALEHWRAQLTQALSGSFGANPIWPAFHDTAVRYSIPSQYFHDMIDGVSSDLNRTRIETFDELYRYCYQVASVAGLALLHIFGCRAPAALALGEKCGVAFQLTNILRDVAEDAARDRIYLPREDMDRFGVRRLEDSESFHQLLRFEAVRAKAYYAEARALPAMVDPACAASLWALIEIYSRLLGRIEQTGFPVLHRRVRLSSLEKSLILVQAWWKWKSS